MTRHRFRTSNYSYWSFCSLFQTVYGCECNVRVSNCQPKTFQLSCSEPASCLKVPDLSTILVPLLLVLSELRPPIFWTLWSFKLLGSSQTGCSWSVLVLQLSTHTSMLCLVRYTVYRYLKSRVHTATNCTRIPRLNVLKIWTTVVISCMDSPHTLDIFTANESIFFTPFS